MVSASATEEEHDERVLLWAHATNLSSVYQSCSFYAADISRRRGNLDASERQLVKWSMGIDEPAFQDGKAVIKKMKK